jgi:hypothetical protein
MKYVKGFCFFFGISGSYSYLSESLKDLMICGLDTYKYYKRNKNIRKIYEIY